MEDFASRLAQVQEQIAAAATRSGRDPAAIELVAVTKTRSADEVRAALREGLLHFGENKVQEGRTKIDEVGGGLWHLIGHLQTNKAKEAVRLFDFIDSVDSLDLAEEIARRAEPLGKTQNVLLQVNVAAESAKFGCTVGDARRLAEAMNALPRLCLRGLMTIAPFYTEPEKARPHFAELRELRDTIQTDTGLQLPVLSMGMSGDFAIAIEEGSTSVRIGTALFGERPKARPKEDASFREST
jgi:pyridoxal phosphate enzyme (YggS family)